MHEYDVTTTFEPMQFESISSSTHAALPESFEVGHMTVIYDAGRDRYVVRQLLTAPSSEAAKQAAVDDVREMLRLLAVSNDAFRTRLGREDLTAVRQPESAMLAVAGTFAEDEEPDPVTGTRTIHVSDVARIGLETHVRLKKVKGSVDFEVGAFSRRAGWPEWLRVALELNYLATTSHEMIPAFVIHYAALELLVHEKLGHPPALLKSRLPDVEMSEFDRRLRLLLGEFGIDEAEFEIERVVNRLYDAHIDSRATRTRTALEKYGVNASSKDIRRIISQRGRVAHGDLGGDPGDLHAAAEQARAWVQHALRDALNCVSNASGT